MDDWNSSDVTLLDPTSLGLCYALAVLFTLSAIFALVRVFFGIFKKHQKTATPHFQTFAMTCAFVFMTCKFLFSFFFKFQFQFIYITKLVRAIYFYLLPFNIASPGSDYTLAVLPTFIYFTTFSVALSIWGTISLTDTVAKRDQSLPTVFKSLVGLNVVLIVLFIICVVTYQAVGADPTVEIQCGHALNTVILQTDAQHSVSIAYASILLIVSFGQAGAFWFFTFKVSRELKLSGSRMRFLYNSMMISLSYFLHGIFILVLVLLSSPDKWFSFFGLIFTEVLPGVAFVYNSFRNDLSSSQRQGETGSNQFSGSQSGGKKGSKKEFSEKGKHSTSNPTDTGKSAQDSPSTEPTPKLEKKSTINENKSTNAEQPSKPKETESTSTEQQSTSSTYVSDNKQVEEPKNDTSSSSHEKANEQVQVEVRSEDV